MRLPLYQIDAFADRPFAGNPAAVLPLDAWLPEERMQAIAAENNLSETVFFVPEGEGYHFTQPEGWTAWLATRLAASAGVTLRRAGAR